MCVFSSCVSCAARCSNRSRHWWTTCAPSTAGVTPSAVQRAAKLISHPTKYSKFTSENVHWNEQYFKDNFGGPLLLHGASHWTMKLCFSLVVICWCCTVWLCSCVPQYVFRCLHSVPFVTVPCNVFLLVHVNSSLMQVMKATFIYAIIHRSNSKSLNIRPYYTHTNPIGTFYQAFTWYSSRKCNATVQVLCTKLRCFYVFNVSLNSVAHLCLHDVLWTSHALVCFQY